MRVGFVWRQTVCIKVEVLQTDGKERGRKSLEGRPHLPFIPIQKALELESLPTIEGDGLGPVSVSAISDPARGAGAGADRPKTPPPAPYYHLPDAHSHPLTFAPSPPKRAVGCWMG